jgi:hypothetical protein
MGALSVSESKPLASLSAGLLARKGGARPAMRRQAQLPGVAMPTGGFGGHDDLGWNDMGYDVDPSDNAHDIGRAASQGLSPMGSQSNDVAETRAVLEDAVNRAIVEPVNADIVPQVSAARPEVLKQQDHIERALAPVAAEAAVAAPVAPFARPTKAARPRAQAGSRGNFAFTLRLDPERHLRLRLASATRNRSVQQILVGLIDDYLSDFPEIDAFAAKLPAQSSRKTN